MIHVSISLPIKIFGKQLDYFLAYGIQVRETGLPSSAALAFKARLLLYAASPLVNGNSEFYSDFKNPDGTFLINQTYDREKWKRAMDAAKEAIDLCRRDGYKLYGNSTNDLEQGKKKLS